MIKQLNCPLTKLNRKKTIYSILKIPEFAQHKDYNFSENYEFKFLSKNKNNAGTNTTPTNVAANIPKNTVVPIEI